MPRKKKTVTPENHTAVADIEAIQKNAGNFDLINKSMKQIDNEYGDGIPFDQERIRNEMFFFEGRMGADALQVGRRLILLKAHLPHGSFLTEVDMHSYSRSYAAQMMKAAIKFNSPKVRSVALLGTAKMLELMHEEDDQLENLVEGGVIAGLNLDDIDKMSVRELKKALRETRENHESDNIANEKLIEDKDKKINQLSKKHTTVDGQVKDFIRQTVEMSTEVIHLLTRLKLLQETYTAHDFGGISDEQKQEWREEADQLMGPFFHGVVRQISSTAAVLITDTDFVFNKYADQCMPDIESWIDALDSGE